MNFGSLCHILSSVCSGHNTQKIKIRVCVCVRETVINQFRMLIIMPSEQVCRNDVEA